MQPSLAARLLEVLAAVAPLAALCSGCGPENCYGTDRDFTFEVDLRTDSGADAGTVTVDSGAKTCQDICFASENDRGEMGTIRSCAFITSATTGGPAVRCDAHESRRCYKAGVVEGRRPAGLIAPEPAAGNALGVMFAHMAHLEAASVPAFVSLGRELRAHNAPSTLIAAARRAARDEVRHHRTMTAHARRHGVEPPSVEVIAHPVRSLEEIAIENAVEGCVREAYGALVAHFQAEHASDEAVRATMTSIAADETRHAELAFAVDDWIAARLDDTGRARVAAAKQRAVEELRAELRADVPSDLVRVAGLPPPVVARALADGATRALWS